MATAKEAYDYLIKLPPRFVPEKELPELTVESISGYLERMNNDPPAHVSPYGNDRDADPNDTVSAPNLPDDNDPQELTILRGNTDMLAQISHYDDITLRAWSVSGPYHQFHAFLSRRKPACFHQPHLEVSLVNTEPSTTYRAIGYA
ncbi:hypothetical protein PENNAL_c0010G07975 [Penicillium nalgiovense]|uniref:Uncharacterized protein n=1 Tax=Penicillium nalgiovense TaxID=60175 RepID=A0A1V6YV78_PENNA|nr:hypothetical protein PENNAL_c0010G07975 [Penicillium nalgiovense]